MNPIQKQLLVYGAEWLTVAFLTAAGLLYFKGSDKAKI